MEAPAEYVDYPITSEIHSWSLDKIFDIDNLNTSEVFTTEWDAYLSYNDKFTLDEEFILSFDKLDSENITLSEMFDRVWTASLTINDNQTLTEEISKSVNKIFDPQTTLHIVRFYEDFYLSISPVHNETVTTSETTLLFNMSTILLDNVTTSENIAKAMGEDRWDDDVTNVALSETFTLEWTALLTLQDNNSLTEILSMSMDVPQSENLVTSEIMSYDVGKTLEENTTLSETFSRVWTAELGAFDYPTLSEALTFNVDKVLTETTNTSETFSPVWTAQIMLTDFPSISETISIDVSTLPSDNVSLTETFEKSLSVQFSDVVNLTEDYSSEYTPGNQNFNEYPTDNPSITESGLINIQNYVASDYLEADYVGTNTTF
jgi:hypothetical protein